jgi:prevent-host-death family protein
MTEIGVETLKARLSDYLERAREGERILITERGRSIALLGPIEAGELAKDQADLRQRALQLSGRFRSGLTDLSVEHDRYLGDAFGD